MCDCMFVELGFRCSVSATSVILNHNSFLITLLVFGNCHATECDFVIITVLIQWTLVCRVNKMGLGRMSRKTNFLFGGI